MEKAMRSFYLGPMLPGDEPIEHDAAGRSAAMHKVDPLAGQVGKSRKVLVCSKPLGLKAANLARRSCTAHDGFAADDPAHRRIVPEALGVIDILVSGNATEYRLPQQTNSTTLLG